MQLQLYNVQAQFFERTVVTRSLDAYPDFGRVQVGVLLKGATAAATTQTAPRGGYIGGNRPLLQSNKCYGFFRYKRLLIC